ncbi:hypothetical protein BTJ68_06170 [Hortaea werneckii EXF-2000]|uniref:F-box domain-containing protein n=2 Tax=Hortaea werneckii TaxID=91943 RepID=A0A3M7IWY0_HORWE|nr:hypothetical protein BTJ68_06170 [Hortaea werneckii EXF-2000]RMZ30039.1 hypothetical protein D0859_05861 [Hortaea werneckii]
MSLCHLPDELLLRVLYFLDIPDLLYVSRTCRHLRLLSFDPLLHRLRLRYSQARISYLLRRRPPVLALQPPISTIYLTRTHLAARRLHWSLICIRLGRALSRRPKLSTLVCKKIVPRECCKRDLASGDIIWGTGIAGALLERKRRVEREHLCHGLRVWLESKAHQIQVRQKDAAGGVGILVWRFSRRLKITDSRQFSDGRVERPRREKVTRLKRFWENLAGEHSSPATMPPS